MPYPVTPDGRYFLVKDRLWRCTNPALPRAQVERLKSDLGKARAAVRAAKSDEEIRQARTRVNEVKVALGERGPVWWSDGAPDVNRHHPKNTAYRQWWEGLQGGR